MTYLNRKQAAIAEFVLGTDRRDGDRRRPLAADGSPLP